MGSSMRTLAFLPSLFWLLLVAAFGIALVRGAQERGLVAAEPAPPKRLDPAAWGENHVGQEPPAYIEGGECLFCHRHQVGVSWAKNRHNLTIREPEENDPGMAALREDPSAKPLAADVQLILGNTRAERFLKRAAAYGKADLLSVAAAFGRGKRARLEQKESPHWDGEKFAKSCAGCHTTAVNPDTQAFSTVSIDCYSCHGAVGTEHATEPELMPLAKARKDSPAAVTSICASCHVRFGKSKSTGLPYPANYVPGDNLFQDFEVDFSVLDSPKVDGEKSDGGKLNPGDAHVLDNVRDVAVYGRESMTCLSCHDVHTGSSRKHFELPVVEYCQHCHTASSPIKGHKNYTVHSQRCEY